MIVSRNTLPKNPVYPVITQVIVVQMSVIFIIFRGFDVITIYIRFYTSLHVLHPRQSIIILSCYIFIYFVST